MMFTAFVLSSCGGGKKQAQNAEEAVAALSIDDVMAKAAELVDQTVTIEGVRILVVMVPRRCSWWVVMIARLFVLKPENWVHSIPR